MQAKEQTEVLTLLDWERQTIVSPGVTRSSDGEVIRELWADGRSAMIVYSSCSESGVDQAIQHQIETARNGHYELEWKVYGHDRPQCLSERLTAAGFEAGARESFMVFPASRQALDSFGVIRSDIRRVTGEKGLGDYRVIAEEVRGESCDKEIERYRLLLENHPNTFSAYVAYVDGEPAACGRVYFQEGSKFAALYGGQTRERFRRRGLFTEIVAVRIREALDRGLVNVCVDALPTSEPILRRHGFKIVTHTQPFDLPAESLSQ